MRRRKYTTKDLMVMAVFISVGMVLQYVENRILVSPVPGGKLGLGNIVSIINIFMFGGLNSIIISGIKATLGTLLSGNVTAMFYSLSGALCSTAVMCIIKKWAYPKVSMIGMSIVGASIHNSVQVFVASLIMSSVYIFSYLPILLVIAVLSGFATGYAAQLLSRRISGNG